MAWAAFCTSQRTRCGMQEQGWQGFRGALASSSLGYTMMTLIPGPRSANFQSRWLAGRILPIRIAWGYQLPDLGHLPWSLWPSLEFWSQVSYSAPQSQHICCYPHGQMRTPGSREAVGWKEMTGSHTLTARDCPDVLCPARPSWFTGPGTISKSEDVHKIMTFNFCFKILHKTGLSFQELSHGAQAYQLVKSPNIAYCTAVIW